jgi:hypothetical protein
MAFMQNIDNPVIVDIFAALADFVAAGRAKRDFFSNRLVTLGAKSH